MKISKEHAGLVTEEALCADLEGNLVACDDPKANWLVAPAGTVIEHRLVARYGIKATVQSRAEEAAEAAEPEPRPSRRSEK